jgi:hypothetical protein
MRPELDIVVYAAVANSASASTERAREIFARAAKQELHLAMMDLPIELVKTYLPDIRADVETVTCLRSVLMKPEHREWLDRIMQLLETSASA